jgi:hypothetical protein
MVPLSFKRFLVGEMKNPRLTFDVVASALGVSVSMLRAWYAAGAKVPKSVPRGQEVPSESVEVTENGGPQSANE